MSRLSKITETPQPAPLDYEPGRHVEAELLRLKDAALRAAAAGDVAFYATYLADGAIGVTPFGVFDKQQILQAMKDGKSFRSKRVAGEHAVALGIDTGLVTYRATFQGPDGNEKDFFVSTIYRRFAGGWKGVFYQQTPLPATQAAR